MWTSLGGCPRPGCGNANVTSVLLILLQRCFPALNRSQFPALIILADLQPNSRLGRIDPKKCQIPLRRSRWYRPRRAAKSPAPSSEPVDLTIAGSAATAVGGGRRDGEKIGRSRVADNCADGIAHKGLALCARSGVGGGATTRTVVTGGTTGTAITAGDPAARASSARPISRASSEAADVAAPAPWRDNDSKVALTIRLRVISYLAIAPTPSAEAAVFLPRCRTR